MYFAECLGSLEVSHKFLGWFPRHLPYFNQLFFLYFVYQGTLHKTALNKKGSVVCRLTSFCFKNTARGTPNVSGSLCAVILQMDRTFHHWTEPFLSCDSYNAQDPHDVISSAHFCNSHLCLLCHQPSTWQCTHSWLENTRTLVKLFINIYFNLDSCWLFMGHL